MRDDGGHVAFVGELVADRIVHRGVGLQQPAAATAAVAVGRERERGDPGRRQAVAHGVENADVQDARRRTPIRTPSRHNWQRSHAGLVTWAGWTAIDAHERAGGDPRGRPRVKLGGWRNSARSPWTRGVGVGSGNHPGYAVSTTCLSRNRQTRSAPRER